VIVSATLDGRHESLIGPPDALVPWWSVGKTVLAAAAFRLAEQGRLDLDVPVAGKPFTPRQLLAHTAGVPDYGGCADYHAAVARGDPAWPVDELLTRAKADELLFAPGTGWAYSNIGYLYIRQLIERATDSELRSALHATVFAPLGLHCFMTRRRDDMRRLLWPSLKDYDPNWVYHGLIAGTSADAARFLDRLFTTPFLSPATRQAMFDAAPIAFTLPNRPFGKPTAGTGLMIDPQGPLGLWYGHSGGGPGSLSAVYRFESTGRVVAAFADNEDEGALERAVLKLAAA
jgi:CubicO group peptidase (beta-lactamase class C family)